MDTQLNNKLVSVFMPVYNGSDYLYKSIKSILDQSYNNFELVMVDDSSTDDSFEILTSYAAIDSRIRLFQKPNGGSVPKSWNYVLPLLDGDYIMYMSQDDFMSEDNIDKLVKRQIETDADCVLPDVVFYYDNKKNDSGRFGVNNDRNVILTNKEAVVLSLNWRIHGFALWGSHLFNDEIFPEDSFDCDEYMVRKLFLKSNKIVFCEGTFYYRQDNNKAITKSFGLKNYYSIKRDLLIYNLLKENKFKTKIVNEKLILLHAEFIKKYKYFLSERAINTKEDAYVIGEMLKDFFCKLRVERKKPYTNFGLGTGKIILYYNYTFFKFFMESRNRIKRLFKKN